MCVCVQRTAGTWTSWTTSWSVCQNSPVTTLWGRWPPCRTPVTSTMAPVSSRGAWRKRSGVRNPQLNCCEEPLTLVFFYCVSVLSLTATATTLPSLVWPRKSRCLNTAQWSRTQWTSTTLSTKWPAIPKSGRFEHRWSGKKAHFLRWTNFETIMKIIIVVVDIFKYYWHQYLGWFSHIYASSTVFPLIKYLECNCCCFKKKLVKVETRQPHWNLFTMSRSICFFLW